MPMPRPASLPNGQTYIVSAACTPIGKFGASGHSRETGVERLMRDAKGAQIYEGTNQIHREIVAGEVLKRAGAGS